MPRISLPKGLRAPGMQLGLEFEGTVCVPDRMAVGREFVDTFAQVRYVIRNSEIAWSSANVFRLRFEH